MVDKKILILGSNGLVGSSCKRMLETNPSYNIVASTRQDTDLFNLDDTKKLIKTVNPDVLIIAAARVGGIHANNTNRVEFLLENLKINMNILESCIDNNSIKIINLGSSCIYPLNASNPINENSIMTGVLEPTNSPYAMAKLTAIEMGRSLSSQYGHNVINLMPTNLYGPNDNFSEMESHVIPALIHKMHKAKVENESEFYIWGTGKPLREFLYVDDLALCISEIIDKNINDDILNVGSSEEVTILQLANIIKDVVGFNGRLLFDPSKPDGNPRKLLDSSKIHDYGWSPKINLRDGLEKTYNWYKKNT
tara:strand:- start:1381 stop:2304 length:924 start_codon:yes stop_codon:yes gene_type:complete